MSRPTRQTTPTGVCPATAISVPGTSSASACRAMPAVHDASVPPGSVCPHSLKCHPATSAIASGYRLNGSTVMSMGLSYNSDTGNRYGRRRGSGNR